MRNFFARFAAEPSLISPEKSGMVNGILASLEKGTTMATLRGENREAPKMQDDFWPEADSWLAEFRPYTVKDGILIIPVKGMLLSGFPFALWDWATGYEYIAKAFERGMSDSAVKGIALDINSPGGEVQGNFDLVDAMYARRGEKPVRSFANEHAYSAAYSIASVADSINVGRTGGVGSIGVVTSHVDFSKYLENAGITITFIYAGAHKVDGNPYQPLPDAVKARIQARIDSIYSIFVSTVARNRGMDEQAVRDTEALTYPAEEAIEIGLADTVGPMDAAFAEFVAAVNATTIGVSTMTTQNNAAAPETTAASLSAADIEKAKAEGMKAAKDRINAIMGLEEAKARPAAANSLAMNTDISVEAAKTALAAMPEEGKATKTNANAFDRAMSSDNPNLGPSGDGDDARNGDDAVARILSAQNAVHGKRPDKKVTA